MISTDAIAQALADLKAQNDGKHAEEMALVRNVAHRIERTNEEILSAVEDAIVIHSDGRNKIAEKLIEATNLIGRLPAPRGRQEFSARPTAAALPHETEDELKLY